MENQTKKILIIEDEKPMAKALELKLNHSGIAVKVAFDGAEGLEVLTKEKFDLVLMDLIMPKMDGFHILAELKKREDKTPIIVLSNLSQEEDLKRAQEFGIRDYFIKSDISINDLVEHVKKLLSATTGIQPAETIYNHPESQTLAK